MTPAPDQPPAHPARLAVVASPAGTVPHLVDLSGGDQATALCGTATAFGRACAWFALAGCKRCVKAATRRGFTHVEDIDGDTVELAE
ncbi:hypothetical protein GCM10009867_17160 [Pedococcus aerophilus]|uniref:Uncharacterized protein n=1 Tax=Pedococcus aerophilus TaxID=436356 RepID=A0ABN3ULR1_9MICO